MDSWIVFLIGVGFGYILGGASVLFAIIRSR